MMPPRHSDPAPMTRNPALDTLRGALLVLMTMTHLPTVWTSRFDQPFGFISAAEGFVFLSAYLCGRIAMQRWQRQGARAATHWLLGRAWKVYVLHLALLLLAFTVVSSLAELWRRPLVLNLFDWYHAEPRRAALSAVALVYRPPLFDIFPMYVSFLLLTIPMLALVRRLGWGALLLLSGTVWTLAQFGLGRVLYAGLNGGVFGSVPPTALGAFDLLAWQFLWTLGLWLGADGIDRAAAFGRPSPRLLSLALVVSCAFAFWRHWKGAGGFDDAALSLLWIDKWTLSPIRLVNLAAITTVLMCLQPRQQRVLRLPWLERLGQGSLWAFAAHLAALLAALLAIDEREQFFAGHEAAVIVLGSLGLMYVAAVLHQRRGG